MYVYILIRLFATKIFKPISRKPFHNNTNNNVQSCDSKETWNRFCFACLG